MGRPPANDVRVMNGLEYTPHKGNGFLGAQSGGQADFTYSMSPDVIAITDLDLGNKSVTNDIENVLRKIEYWHQGSIATFRIMYRDSLGVWERGALERTTSFLFALQRVSPTKVRKVPQKSS